MMRWLRTRRTALLMTPKGTFLKQGAHFMFLRSLTELSQYKITSLDVFLDGFPQSFVNGSLPLVGLFDQPSAVYHKLSRDFKPSAIFGGTFLKDKSTLLYHGYGFEDNQKLSAYLQEICDLKIPILSVQSLVFSCATTLFPYCISQIGAQSLLWISPYLGSGYRLVFYHEGAVKFVRTIAVHKYDQTRGAQDVLQTLTYIQNEYHLDHQGLTTFLTSFDANELKGVKTILQSENVYQWDIQGLSEKQDTLEGTDTNMMESWLLSYAQESKKIWTRMISHSPLMPLIRQTKWMKQSLRALQALCVVLGVLIGREAIHLWKIKCQLYVAQKSIGKMEEQLNQFKKQLKIPLNTEVLKFYAYLTSQKDLSFEQDPFILITSIAEQLSPDILVREVLWQKGPKTTLKLALKCVSVTEEDKAEILNEFKKNLFEFLKQKSKVKITMNQTAPDIMEINLS